MKKPGHLVYRQQWESLARGDRLSTPQAKASTGLPAQGKSEARKMDLLVQTQGAHHAFQKTSELLEGSEEEETLQ